MADTEPSSAPPVESASAPEPVDAPKLADAKDAGDAPAPADGKPQQPAAAAESTEKVADAADEDVNNASLIDASAVDVSQVNGDAAATPASSKKQRKKSIGGTPAKKLARKKSTPDLHTDVQPGEHWYVRMKGYAPWPAIICDEKMLPVSLLERRPVSAMDANGTWRADFDDGGRNMRDRRYPVMFLGTNEFAWHVNTELLRLDLDEIKGLVASGEQGKKSKKLWEAYEVAAENHELQYFKDMLNEHDKILQEEQARLMEAEEEKLAKREKKAKAKVAVDDDGDVDMAESDEPPKKKSSNKRKKDADEDTSKKTKIVLKGLKSSGDDAEPAPKKPRKSKGPPSDEEEKTPQPPVNEEDARKRKGKTILYLRHKLQKGLVSREVPPKPEEMDTMADHLSVLEQHQDLEANIIRDTKAHKLLKVILKLKEIPRDLEFKFKERCNKLLAAWSKTLAAAEGAEPSATAAETATNGVDHGKEEAKTAKPTKAKPAEAETNGEAKDTAETKDKVEAEAAEPTKTGAEDKPAPSIEMAAEA